MTSLGIISICFGVEIIYKTLIVNSIIDHYYDKHGLVENINYKTLKMKENLSLEEAGLLRLLKKLRIISIIIHFSVLFVMIFFMISDFIN